MAIVERFKNEKGQSLVEFAIILPILILIVMAIIEMGLILNSYLTIHNAARQGARIGIVGSNDTDIANDIKKVCPELALSDLNINITPSYSTRKAGDVLKVVVTYNYKLTVPIISSLLSKSILLKAQVSMRVE